MGYLFLALALLAGGVKGYCGKKVSNAITLSSDSMVMNVLRMVLCVVIGFLLILIEGDIGSLAGDPIFLGIALFSGVSSAIFLVSWLLSVKSGAYMLVEVFLLLGVSVTIALCRIFFDERVTLRQTAGVILLFVAVYIMCTYNTSIKGKMKLSSLLLLVLCGVANGLSDFSQKVFVKVRPESSVAAFNLYTYLFAGIVLFVACLIFRRAEKKGGAEIKAPFTIIKPIWIFVLIMAACLFANSFFKTRSAEHLDAVQLYPLSQGAAVVISLFLSSVVFKEKINLRCIIGIVLSFAALLLINL